MTLCEGKLSCLSRGATTASACRYNPTCLRSIPTTLLRLFYLIGASLGYNIHYIGDYLYRNYTRSTTSTP
ncbi:hypothetical protein M433DRAFT_236665 [Acidomyces richmondensis BFW]|nr:hypothetical protein M433DRAFT_236665 [Acidomyces richmondensis BFW]